MSPEEFNQHLSNLLIKYENKEALIQSLSSGIANAQDDITKLVDAWKPIVTILNKDYYIARDKTEKFDEVSPLINSLELIVQECVSAFDGKAASADFIGDIVQLHFKCSNYFSLASTLSPANLGKCTSWLEKAGAFIDKNDLTDTRSHAIWHNLIGGHESRQYQMGLMELHPESSVEHFRQAVRIQRDVLGNKVNAQNAVELRHVMMCLGSTLVHRATSLALCVTDYAQLDKDLQEIVPEADAVLSQLTDDCLVLPQDGKPDLYRRAGTKQYTGYLALLQGDFDRACSLLDQAAIDMEKSLPATGAKGQLSQILNDVAKMHDAKAAAVRLRSIELSENDFEQMYADNAKRDLARSNNNPYSRLGEIVVKLNQYRAEKVEEATASPVLLFGNSSQQISANDVATPKCKLGQ